MRYLGIATLIAAVSGFVVIFLAAWALGADGADAFQAYWGLFFAITGVMDGLTQETTRAVASAKASGIEGSARPWRTATAVALTVGLAVVGSSVFWIYDLIPNQHGVGLTLLVIGLVSYAYQALVAGLLSGLGLWRSFGHLLVIDAVLRLGLTLVAWRMGAGLRAFLIITVAGAFAWMILACCSRDVRSAARALTDVSQTRYRRGITMAMLATGSSAAMVTGFPVAIRLTSDGMENGAVTVAGIMMAVTLTRAPILIPLQRFQPTLIVRFVRERSVVARSVVLPVVVVMSIGFLGSAGAWLIGPWIIGWILPDGFYVPGGILAILTFASALTGTLMITGAAVLVMGKHVPYVAGWIMSTVVAFAVLSLGLPLHWGVCIALIVGPLSGIAWHLSALLSPNQGEIVRIGV